MTVNVTKPAINLREKLSELDKPSGIAGQDILKADTPQEVFNYIGAGRRNLLINGDFQVSQRGDYSSATNIYGGNYYLDRWQLHTLNINPTLTHSTVVLPNGQNVKSQKVTATTAATGYGQMRQKLENFLHLRGQTVTLSAWVRTNKGNVHATGLAFYDNGSGWSIGDDIPNDGNWHYVTHTVQVSNTISTYPEITIQHNNTWAVGEYIETALFQLELGSVATPFEHRSYGEELALCQRYFWTLIPRDGRYSTQGCVLPLQNYTNSSDEVFIAGEFPEEMRATPTISNNLSSSYNTNTSAGWAFREWYVDTRGNTSLDIAPERYGRTWTIRLGNPDGAATVFYTQVGDDTVYVDFDAEL